MKVLLTTINSKYIHQNLAIRILKALNSDYPELEVKEFELKSDMQEIIRCCLDFELVAFSCYIWNISRTLEVSKEIKRLNPQCRIMLGGPEVSYEWNDVIALPEIDIIITGEGEFPFSEFLKKYPEVGTVPSLIWKKDGQVIQNKASMPFDLQQFVGVNMDEDVDGTEMKHRISYIETSRGCPGSCDFCLASLDRKVRFMPWSVIESRLRFLMDHGKVIKFLDRTFNAKTSFALKVFQFILDHHKPGNVFQFEIKADMVRPEFVDFIQKYIPKGLFRFEIGIQTLNSKSNDAVGRKQNFDRITKFIREVSAVVEIHLDLIVGLPYDYMQDIRYSFDEVFKLKAPELQLGFLKFLKGTPIRKNLSKHGYQFMADPPYQILSSHYLSEKEIERVLKVEHVLDVFWNKKRALHSLAYLADNYSVFDFFEGLGNHWDMKNGLKNTGIAGLFQLLHEYVLQNNPDDLIFRELIALDFYLQHKVKPKNYFLKDIDKKLSQRIIENHKLNHHKFRYAIHSISFSMMDFLDHKTIISKRDWLILEFSGTQKPRIIMLDPSYLPELS